MKLKWRDLASIIILGVALLPFLYPHLEGSRVLVAGDVGGSDATDFVYSTKFFLAQKIKGRQLPLWGNDIGFGFPLAAEGQVQAFYPLSLLFLVLPIGAGIVVSLWLTLLTLGAGLYLLGRCHRLPILVSLLSASAFTLSSAVTMRWKHPALLCSLSWLPLELLVIELWSREVSLNLKWQSQIKSALKLGFLIGLQFLAGHPQTTLYSLTAISLYAFLKAILNRSQAKLPQAALVDTLLVQYLLQTLFLMGLALVVGLLIGAPQVLATWELNPFSQLKTLSIRDQLPFPFKLKHLITFLVPFSFGDPSLLAPYLKFNPQELAWEISLYPGLFFAFLVIIGVLGFRLRQARDYLWLFLALIFILFGTGNLLGGLPLFNRFRVPGRFLILALLFTCLLGGSLLNNFLTEIKAKTFSPLPKQRRWQLSTQQLLTPALVILLLANGIDLWVHLRQYNVSLPEPAWLNNPTAHYLESRLGPTQRFATLDPVFIYNRLYAEQRGWRSQPEAYTDYWQALPPNSGLVFNLPSLEAYAGALLKKNLNFSLYAHSAFIPNESGGLSVAPAAKPLLALSAAKYFLSPQEITDQDFQLVKELPFAHLENPSSLKIYEYQKSLPLFFLVSRLEKTANLQETQQRIAFGNYWPSQTAFSEAVPESKDYTGQGRLELREEQDGYFLWDFESPLPQLLFISETFYPGWQATIDGNKSPLIPANYAFMAVEVPAGKHLVSLQYRPTYLPLAFYLSGGTLLLGGLALIVFRRRG